MHPPVCVGQCHGAPARLSGFLTPGSVTEPQPGLSGFLTLGSVTEPQPGLSDFLTLGQPQAALPINRTWSLRGNSFACADLDHK